MSWSVSAIGKAPTVRKAIASQFASGGCSEPEETVRKSAAALLDAALSAQDATMVLNVIASGSMSYKDWTAKTGVSNSLTISVTPMYGFVE